MRQFLERVTTAGTYFQLLENGLVGRRGDTRLLPAFFSLIGENSIQALVFSTIPKVFSKGTNFCVLCNNRFFNRKFPLHVLHMRTVRKVPTSDRRCSNQIMQRICMSLVGTHLSYVLRRLEAITSSAVGIIPTHRGRDVFAPAAM